MLRIKLIVCGTQELADKHGVRLGDTVQIYNPQKEVFIMACKSKKPKPPKK